MKKLLIFTLLAVAVIVIAYLALGRNSPKKYITQKVERGEISSVVSATGTINAVTTVQVGSQVSGVIGKIFVDFNSKVNRGQVIAQIDPEPFKTRVEQARANLEALRASTENALANVEAIRAGVENARANLERAKAEVEKARVQMEDAKRNLDRVESLWKEGLIAEKDRDTAQTNYETSLAQIKASQASVEAAMAQHNSTQAQLKVAEAQYRSALAQVRQGEATLESAQLDLSHTTIISPVDGIVVSRNVDVGQTVAASLQAPTLFLIAQDLTKMQVNANISEADIGLVREGSEATFTVDAYPGMIFKGRINQVRNAPIIVQNVVTYDVVIGVENPELKLKPGMTTNVTIPIVKRENVLKIPTASLRFKPDLKGKGGKEKGQSVWVLTGKGGLKEVSVKIGIRDGNFAELLEGDLKEDQEVVIGVTSKREKESLTPPGFGGLQRMRF